jgi:hypothetical protein
MGLFGPLCVALGLGPTSILFEAVAQLLGGVNVVVTGPQFSKVNPDSVEALGILVVLEVMISMIAI